MSYEMDFQNRLRFEQSGGSLTGKSARAALKPDGSVYRARQGESSFCSVVNSLRVARRAVFLILRRLALGVLSGDFRSVLSSATSWRG